MEMNRIKFNIRIQLLLILGILLGNLQAQNRYIRTLNPFQEHESAMAMLFVGDSIYIRGNYFEFGDTVLSSLLGIFSLKSDTFLNIRRFKNVQAGDKNVILNGNDIILSSQESEFNHSISVNYFDKNSLDLIGTQNLQLDSSKYFSYTIGPSLKFLNKVILCANVLDSTVFVNYPGWFNYQEKTILFILNEDYSIDTTLIISPSSGAFLKAEDMALGVDSILYLSFYERYLKHGSSEDYLADRKIVLGFDKSFNIVFQWQSPDFDVLESQSSLTLGMDNSIFVNYYSNYHTYIVSIKKNGLLNWESLIDPSIGINLYNINRIIQAKNGDIIGVGRISSAHEELGESAFIFRVNSQGNLLWKKVFRINKGFDLTLPENFPYQSALEDVIEAPNGDLFSIGFVRKYNGIFHPGSQYNYDLLLVRTDSTGCVTTLCSNVQDVIFRDEYIPVVTSLNEWVVDGSDLNGQIHRYTFDYDSVLIQDKYYFKLIYSRTIQTQWEETGRLFREQGGLVFELNIEDSTEQVIYNFNLQPGDTLPSHNDGSNNYREIFNVFNTKLLDEVPRKSLEIRCSSDVLGIDSTIWIEGIGDIEYLFWSKTFCSSLDDTILHNRIRCFLVNKQLLYSRPEIEGCYLTSIDNPNLETLIIFPNPTSDNIYFEFSNDQILDKVSIFNSLGQLILRTSKLNDDNSLLLDKLSKGIYFGSINFKNGSRKIFKFLYN